MRFISPTILVSLALLAGIATASSEVHINSLRRKRHVNRQLVDRSLVEQNVTARALEKRFSDARFTFYAAGLGACGKTNSGSDFIVALNSAQYNGGSHCFETITISVNGKTHSAEIVDECPGCPFGGLDFSEGLFQFFAPESVGVLTGSWNFGGSAAPPPPPPKPTTHTPPPPSPPKTTQHHTTSTLDPPATTHTSATPTSTSSDALQSSSQSPTTSSGATSTPAAVNNVEQMYLAFVQMGAIVMAAPGASGSN
ncbi:RlpA-like double-psi beta-barrel-protein domain-containing protein-containing protein [Pholiota molesta]|nr:RlpA-like double-psi beta-barrel-protein domain-containing protein-containing protein [Pholiota molesta]